MAGINDEIGSLLDEQQQGHTGQLQRTMYLTADKNPESETTLHRISQRSGIPVEALRLDGGKEGQKQALSREIEMLPAHAPATARFLSAHDNAAVAHDDWQNLSTLEKVIRSVKDFPGAVKRAGGALSSAFESGQLQQEQGRLAYQQMVDGDTLEGAGRLVYLDGEIERRQQVIDNTSSLGLLTGAQIAGQMWESGKKGVKLGLGAGMTAGGVAAVAGQAGPQALLPEEVITVPAAFSAAFGAGTTYGLLEDVRQVEAGQAYQELRSIRGKNGEEIPRDTAASAASVVGTINAAIEGAGLKLVTAPVKRMLQREVMGAALKTVEEGLVQQTMTRAATRFGKDYGMAIGAEAGQEVAQELTNVVAEELAKGTSSGEFDEASVGEIGQRLWSVAWQTASGMAWLGLSPAGAGFYSDAKAARAARRNSEFFNALGEATQNVKLKDRLPDKLVELVDTITAEGDAPFVYAPADRFSIFWQERGMDPGDVAETVGVSREELQTALATGGDIAIPTSQYAAKVAGTEHHAELSQDLRLRVGDMTAREAQEFEAQRSATVQGLVADAEAMWGDEAGRPANWSEGAAKVYDDVLGQLLGAKLPQGTAEKYAALWAEHYQARAQRLGKDAGELYTEKPLDLRNELPPAPWRNVDLSVDPMLDTLRPGKIPSDSDLFGPSLTRFIQGLGGLQDQGGELRHMDAKGLKRKKGLTFDRAREAAVEAGYLAEGATVTDFLDAIARELKGDATYAPGNENGKAVQERLQLEQMQELVDRAGVDLAQMSNEEARQRLNQVQWQDGRLHADKLGYFIPGGERIDIGLLPKADLSTFLHETGHAWLEELREDATAEGAPEQLRKDWEIVREKYGITDEAAPIPRESHEAFADSFLAYLQEGKAPSENLRQIFRSFKAWLKRLFTGLRMLEVELSPEVRGVFDRMLAAEPAVEEAWRQMEGKPVFATAEDAGMSEIMFKAYQEDLATAHEQAVEHLEQELLREHFREQKAWWKERKAQMTDEVSEEAHESPVYRVLSFLTTGKLPDGSEPMAPLKLDRAALVNAYGEEFVKNLPRAFGRIYAAGGGVHPSVVSELFGFESADEMIRQMAAAPSMKRWIAAEVAARMNERYGNMMLDGTLPAEATKAAHNEGAARVLRAEIRALNSKARQVGPYVKAAKEEAQARLEQERKEREYEKRWMDAEQKLAVAIERGAKQEEILRLREEASTAKREEQQARRAARESIPPVTAFREAARITIAGRMVGALDPKVFQQAERRAAKAAYVLAQRKEYAKAAEEKRKQLLNFYLFQEASRAKAEIDKALEGFKRIFKGDEKLAKSRNTDLVAAARAILGAHGIGPEIEGGPLAFLLKVQQYNPQLFEDLQMAVDMATQGAMPYKRLSVTDFFAMKDAVDNLWHLSRRERMVEIDGQLVSKEEVIGELEARLQELGLPDDGLGTSKGVAMRDKVSLVFAGWRSILRRVESWADAMDGGNLQGPFRRFIWQPVSEAADQYRTDKAAYLQRFRELFRPLEDTLAPRDIAAPELGLKGYTFTSKAELLGALLHTGNESNLAKLLVGRKWGYIEEEDGGLVTERWDAFVSRMWQEGLLTKADYDFVQNVWDLLDELKPQAQKTHRDMFGFYFAEITAHPVETPWGIYKGGYFPAATDPFIVSEAAIREGRDVVLENSSRLFPDRPTTGRGFTKSRVENYRKALSLDMRLAPVHIDKVLRFIHLEPRVKDVTRVVTNADMADMLDQWDKTLLDDMLMPWLERSAKQSLSTGSRGFGGKGLDRVWQALRRRTGLQTMVLNVTNSLQQLTGLTISMVKVDGAEMRRALWNYMKAPGDVADFAAEHSPFMAERIHGETFKMMGELEQLLEPSKFAKVRDFSIEHGYFMQHMTQNIVDVMTWTAGYNGAVAEGMSERDAVRAADSAVRETQGSFNPEDISRAETGHPFVRLFTQFYSYFNMLANLLGTEFLNTVRELGYAGGSGRLFYVYLMGFAIPAFLSELLVRVMSGKLDDDDDGEYLDDILGAFFMGQVRTGAAMVPGVGQASMALLNMTNDKAYDDRLATSPSITAIESALRAPVSVYGWLEDDKSAKQAVRDSLTLIGMMTGMPAGALGRPLGYLANVQQGREEVSGPVDFTRGVVTGR